MTSTGSAGFAKEGSDTRISRDVFLHDPRTGEFLVKPWGDGHHRGSALYGNAFGTFLCRPPKDDEDLRHQLAPPVSARLVRLTSPRDARVLAFNVRGVVGHKTGILNDVLRRPFAYERAAGFIACVMPSKDESRTSTLAAANTTLAYFVHIDRKKMPRRKGYVWISAKDATDPGKNVHASVVAAYLYCMPSIDRHVYHGSNLGAILKRLDVDRHAMK